MKAYFCKECKKVFTGARSCDCQTGENMKEIKLGTPVNVIGTKLKGKVYRIKEDRLELLITSSKNKYLKEFTTEEVRKIL